ncbi:hypothetical protein P691DRAFT_413210 [Macrolepiota fuliginosa MF-IS2]|uniref:Uncharacterized protein n=1 Tax=Macrolepiota fuliginosa MF-IS2 TaxID=1400762 RepID=A0A9P5X3L3_9AGAR|nr:hypothetical protein P691DRAFT_413210 [Macrolepiota fuliginosa MF-IS2]
MITGGPSREPLFRVRILRHQQAVQVRDKYEYHCWVRCHSVRLSCFVNILYIIGGWSFAVLAACWQSGRSHRVMVFLSFC